MKPRMLLTVLAGLNWPLHAALAQHSIETHSKPAAATDVQTQAALAGPTARPFLWMIERDPPAFLYGTVHLADDRVMEIPPVVQAAFDTSDAFITEIPMDMTAMAREMAPRMMLPEGQSLKDILPASLYERADKYLKARGQSMAAMNRYRLWAAAMQIGLIDLMKEVGALQGLDMYLANEARLDEKTTGGLETIAEQIDAFDGLTASEQIESLKKSLDYLEKSAATGRKLGRELLDAYYAGNEAALIKLMEEQMDPKDPVDAKSFDLLITQRDNRMAARIDKRLKDAPTESPMFAVGAYHLIGPKVNVITHLKDRGYKIRRLTAADLGDIRRLSRKAGTQPAADKGPGE